MVQKRIDQLITLYGESAVPVVVFSDEMIITWNNSTFGSYFPGRLLKNENISAITRLQLRTKLAAAPGNSGRFQFTLKMDDQPSSVIVLLIFPLDCQNSRPDSFIGFVDDITVERNMTLRKTYLGLLEASKLKDDDTGNHIKRVGAYARRLSEECYKSGIYPQIDPDFVENINFLAQMHDVGKIGTPDEILTKRGGLTESQWAIMREHTINGALILSNYPDSMATEIARAHHEKWNGSGYLFGLAGEDIPLSARITAIADVYDALRMRRSYKEPIPHDETIRMMSAEAGIHFDPVLIKVFMSINEAFEGIFEALADDTSKTEEIELEDLPVYNDHLNMGYQQDMISVYDYGTELEELEELSEAEEI